MSGKARNLASALEQLRAENTRLIALLDSHHIHW
jgi:hypothetical protein